MTAAIDRDELTPFSRRRYAEIPWGENGAVVRIQSLTEAERYDIERRNFENKRVSIRALAIAKTLVDEAGRRIFSDEQESIDFIESLDSQVTNRLYAAIDQHIGTPEDTKHLEEIAKN